ncbi:MAG: tetratricopeptide repeat protein [Blastocatellia bacterium]|nr:tetratricopeptide repeat protein [Blastocatellia bacterium]
MNENRIRKGPLSLAAIAIASGALSLFCLFGPAPDPVGAAMIQQNNRNSISGVVMNTANQPLQRIRVELQDEVEMSIMQTYTDGSGHYYFRNLSQGTFTVKVHSDATYAGRSVRVTLFQARAGGGYHQEQVDIVIKSREEVKKPSVPGGNTGSTFAQEIPDNARKIYDRAVRQLENPKQAEEGFASLKEALKVFPTYYLALERLGVEYVKRQQYEPARETLLKAREVNPTGAPALYVLGVSQFYLRQLPEAADSLGRSLQLAPDSPNAALAHFYRGLAFWNTGKHAEAEPHLKKCYELGGNTIPPDVHMHLAQYYSDKKRYKDAAEELEMFLKLAPDATDAPKIKGLIKQLREKAASAGATQKLVSSSSPQ